MIRFLCKRDLNLDNRCIIPASSVAYVDFNQDYAYIPFVKTNSGDKIGVEAKLDHDDFIKNFVMYDDDETINAMDMMKMLIFKHGQRFREKETLFRLRSYFHNRLNFLKSCTTKEDTRTE